LGRKGGGKWTKHNYALIRKCVRKTAEAARGDGKKKESNLGTEGEEVFGTKRKGGAGLFL